ncbi:MAG TPA: hypothetical protein VFW53_09345 [Gallionella sp.]|nr:hypothetical protein [Gallionella sp.]
MKLSANDFMPMRRSLLALCAATLIGAATVYFTGQYAQQAQREREQAQARLDDARTRLANAREDSANMDAYLAEYAALERRKIVGDEQRLDWMEGLENIRQRNLVAGFGYTIAPQKSYVPPLPLDSGNFDVRYSEMKLQLELLHEAQLLAFFDALRSQINGWYQLEGCALTRIPDAPPGAPQLKAECSGGWITLKSRSAPR